MLDIGIGGNQSIDSFLDQALGSVPPGEPTAAATGAPPVEPPATTATTGSEAQPTDDAAPATPGEPTADASADAAAPVTETPTEEDPWAASTPLTYTVNGQARTFDAIRVMGTDGAAIKPEHLPDVMRRLGERDNLYEQNQAQHKTLQRLEALSEWKQRGENGEERSITGHDGLMEVRSRFAQAVAERNILLDALTNPDSFRRLVAVGEDGTSIVLNPDAAELLQAKIDAAQIQAKDLIRTHFESRLGEIDRPAAPSGTPDYSAEAPAIVTQAAGPLASALTPDDVRALAAFMPNFIRPSTPQERQANPKQLHTVDFKFIELVRDRAQMRQSAKPAAAAPAAGAAASSNAARLLAASRGGAAKPVAGKKPAPPAAPVNQRVTDADTAWEMAEKASAAALRRHA